MGMEEEVKPRASIGLVGGSDIKKIAEQMRGMDVVKKYDYFFSENGLVAYKGGELIAEQSILKKFGEKNLQKMINFSLRYMSELELPAKRGTFVEFRTGLINLCPVGRSCSYGERLWSSWAAVCHGRADIHRCLPQRLGQDFLSP